MKNTLFYYQFHVLQINSRARSRTKRIKIQMKNLECVPTRHEGAVGHGQRLQRQRHLSLVARVRARRDLVSRKMNYFCCLNGRVLKPLESQF